MLTRRGFLACACGAALVGIGKADTRRRQFHCAVTDAPAYRARFFRRGGKSYPILGASIQRPSLWGFDQGATPGTGKITLDVYFMDGGYNGERELVKAAAETWRQAALGDRVEFRFNQSFWFNNPADFPIRVHFGDGDTNTSQIGTDALKIPSDKPTMTLAQLSAAYDEQEKSDLLSHYTHEFGHVLGLHHEHQGSNGRLHWNLGNIVKDLDGVWTRKQIEENLTRSYARSACPTEAGYHGLDAASIMIYPLQWDWTREHFGARRSGRISARDRACVAYIYNPKHNARIKSHGVAS